MHRPSRRRCSPLAGPRSLWQPVAAAALARGHSEAARPPQTRRVQPSLHWRHAGSWSRTRSPRPLRGPVAVAAGRRAGLLRFRGRLDPSPMLHDRQGVHESPSAIQSRQTPTLSDSRQGAMGKALHMLWGSAEVRIQGPRAQKSRRLPGWLRVYNRRSRRLPENQFSLFLYPSASTLLVLAQSHRLSKTASLHGPSCR